MRAAGSGTLLLTTGGGAIDPYPMLATANIAQDYWKLHTDRDRAEHVISA